MTVASAAAVTRSAIFSSVRCQKRDWPSHQDSCQPARRINPTHVTEDTIIPSPLKYFLSTGDIATESWPKTSTMDTFNITVKHRGKKINVNINAEWPGTFIMKLISSETSVPLDKVKVIIKGKIQTQDTIATSLHANALIMLIGETCEASDGVDERDISCLMSQMGVSRNQAVKSLRKCDSLLDAMMDVGNSR